jgi:hypothetical protein
MSPTVAELHELTTIRDKAIKENAKNIADGILRAIYGTVDEYVDSKVLLHPNVEENDLEGVVRLGLKVAVLSRLEDSLAESLACARADFREAWHRRSAT